MGPASRTLHDRLEVRMGDLSYGTSPHLGSSQCGGDLWARQGKLLDRRPRSNWQHDFGQRHEGRPELGAANVGLYYTSLNQSLSDITWTGTY